MSDVTSRDRARIRRSPTPGSAASEPTAAGEPPPLLRLQRLAGNAAVAAAVRDRIVAVDVQRRTEPGDGQTTGGVLPGQGGPTPTRTARRAGPVPGVAEHLMSDAELAAMPSVGDTPALKAEYQQIKDAWKARVATAEAAEKAGQTVDQATKQLTPVEKKRLAEIDKLMVLRKRGDEEETLKANGITTGTAAWFAEVTSTTFLNHSIICHRLLAERLALAEKALENETPPAAGWFGGAHSLRKVGESLHSFGLAIDIDGGRNPYLVNPSATNARFVENPARSKAISDVIGRAQLLVEGTTPAEADFHTRPTNADKDARAMASYDKLQTASNALATYFTLDTAAGRANLDARITALAGKDSRTAAAWVQQIKADRRTLDAQESAKSWNQPTTGFLHLDRRLVSALTSSAGGGLTWLGDDTVGSGRDIMHFDLRGLGPIRRIVKTIEGQTISLGNG
jgi:hypothetical protein